MQNIINRAKNKLYRTLNELSFKTYLVTGGRDLFHGSGVSYASDGLITSHVCGFADDVAFQKALAISRREMSHPLYHIYRLFISSRLMLNLLEKNLVEQKPLVFVECGVGEGHTFYTFYQYCLALGRTPLVEAFERSQFVLMDTFAGVALDLVPDELLQKQTFVSTAYHGATVDVVRKRFSFISNLQIIEGKIPATLSQIPQHLWSPDFLHIDMNNPIPECEAVRFFYPNMKKGSVILFDDYAFQSAASQKQILDQYFAGLHLSGPITLPTGQGIKII